MKKNKCYLELTSQMQIDFLIFKKDIPNFIKNFTDFYDERNNIVRQGYAVIVSRSNGKYTFYRAKSLPDNCIGYLDLMDEMEWNEQ